MSTTKDDIDWQAFALENLDVDLGGLSQLCDVQVEMLLEFVAQGVHEPQAGADARDWRFGASEVRRGRAALRLQRELSVNLAGAALALDLLDELQLARRRILTLERLLAR